MFKEEEVNNNLWGLLNSENSGKKPQQVAGEKRGRKRKVKAGSSGNSRDDVEDVQGEESDSDVHIWTERERRKKMKNMFSSLHALLPHLPPKTDKSSIVDEAINYIQTLEQTLQTLQKQKLEKFQKPTIPNLDHPFPIAVDTTRRTYMGHPIPTASSRNSSIASNMSLLAPTNSEASFRTWFFPNVVMNMCGNNDAQICVCSSRKLGLLTTICYILGMHKVEVVSANVSSDHQRCMLMIHVHADGPSAKFPQASIEETFKLAVGEIVSWIFSY